MSLHVLFLYYVWVSQCGMDQPEELLDLWPLPGADSAKAVLNIQLEDLEVAEGRVRWGEKPICASRGVGRCFQTFVYWAASSWSDISLRSPDLPCSSSGSDHTELRKAFYHLVAFKTRCKLFYFRALAVQCPGQKPPKHVPPFTCQSCCLPTCGEECPHRGPVAKSPQPQPSSDPWCPVTRLS